jgi:hypothetical protein
LAKWKELLEPKYFSVKILYYKNLELMIRIHVLSSYAFQMKKNSRVAITAGENVWIFD